MALLEEQFTETLNAGAPDITYEGSEGREQQIAQALWDRLPPQARMQFGSFQQFFSSGAWKKVLQMLQQQMQGQEGPQEQIQETQTETMGAAPQAGLGALMPQPQPMGMAYGGTPGADGRRQYGIGSWFQKKIMDPIKKNPLISAAVLGAGANFLPGPTNKWIPNLWNKLKTAGTVGNIKEGLGSVLKSPEWMIPAASLVAGAFAKPEQQLEGGAMSRGAGINLQDIAKLANITDEQQGQAIGLNFLPEASARKYSPEEMALTYSQAGKAHGGRIGYRHGKTYKDKTDREKFGTALREDDIAGLEPYFDLPDQELLALLEGLRPSRKQGRSRKQEGGLMNLGGMEKDYRNDGGFVPIGGEEKADDVPARLSRNEFVFTADAVRNAGGGDMDRGAEVMENVMKNLEGGGRISDESQGKGAGEMFEVSERLSEVV